MVPEARGHLVRLPDTVGQPRAAIRGPGDEDPRREIGGADTLVTMENLTGSPFDDSLAGDANPNTLDGSGGNDVVNGGAGNDALIGGAGNDTASFASSGAAIVANLRSGTASGSGNDTLSSIENLTGTKLADRLTGDPSPNMLRGGSGNDSLRSC